MGMTRATPESAAADFSCGLSEVSVELVVSDEAVPFLLFAGACEAQRQPYDGHWNKVRIDPTLVSCDDMVSVECRGARKIKSTGEWNTGIDRSRSHITS